MPASGRMLTKIVSKPQQTTIIESPFPLPWSSERPIFINFDLWCRLTKAQRDLLILRNTSARRQKAEGRRQNPPLPPPLPGGEQKAPRE